MACKLKKRLAHKSNYGSKRSTKNIKFFVWHYTTNDGDSDENNGKYFANNVVKASAHAFADSDSITESVPDNYTAYAVGGSKYSNCKETGGGKFYGECTNSNSLSLELCDDKRNGSVYPSEQTIENALVYTAKKIRKYKIAPDHVIRHFDVNGKPCPGYWCGSKEKDELWQKLVIDRLDPPDYKVRDVITCLTERPVRKKPQKGAAIFKHKELFKDGQKHDKDKDGRLDKGSKMKIKAIKRWPNGNIWVKIPCGGWVAVYYNGVVYAR